MKSRLSEARYERVRESIHGLLASYPGFITIDGLVDVAAHELKPLSISHTELRQYVKIILFDLSTANIIEPVSGRTSEINFAVRGGEALTDAARRGEAEVIARLLHFGFDAETMNAALISAVINNRIEAVRQLIEGGADVNATEELFHRTPLMYARIKGNEKMIKLLEEAGAL